MVYKKLGAFFGVERVKINLDNFYYLIKGKNLDNFLTSLFSKRHFFIWKFRWVLLENDTLQILQIISSFFCFPYNLFHWDSLGFPLEYCSSGSASSRDPFLNLPGSWKFVQQCFPFFLSTTDFLEAIQIATYRSFFHTLMIKHYRGLVNMFEKVLQ